MWKIVRTLVGPRVPQEELARNGLRYAAPGMLLAAARVLLLISIFLPYWDMELEAPQYPDGLYLTAYVNHLSGDVREIDGLNHYIGMRPLEEAGSFERSASIWMIVAMVLLMEGAAHIHSRWALLLALPALLFPAVFLLDLKFWMSHFGQNLDPAAPLSASVKPFTPTLVGEGGIGQFKTYGTLCLGYWLACSSSLVAVIGFYFHRRAYQPLHQAAPGSTGDPR